jgi:YihY family inner membrane protein
VNKSQKLLKSLDKRQQHHRVSAFVVAVIKKYEDDGAGRHAVMLTYYSFLSLFPLLLVLTTIVDTFSTSSHLRSIIIKGVTNYFPVLGDQLSNHVHGLHTSHLALITGLLFTLYGTRGVANAFTRGVQTVWEIPESEHDKFPKTLYKNFPLVLFGGVGLIIASVLASLASAVGKGIDIRVLSISINLLILFWLFRLLLELSLPRHISFKETRAGAASAAIGLVILQTIGGYVLSHELRHLSALYSYFALTLGLLFWLYLQSQVLYYAMEVAIVSSRKDWPQSFLS